jgi:hypothetical protein
MAETINCNDKYTKPKPPPGKEDSKTRDGKYQADADWMRRGGRNPDIKR